MTDELITVPHANGSEKCVLSTILRNPDKFEEAPDLSEDYFFIPAHKKVFRLLRELYTGNKLIELVSFVQELHDRGELEMVGGSSAVAEINSYGRDPHFLTHLEKLKEKRALRMALELSRRLEDYALENDLEGALDTLGQPVTAIFDGLTGVSDTPNIQSQVKTFMDKFIARASGASVPKGIPYGIAEIDRYLPGFVPEQYLIISGRSGSGKSTLATEFLANITEGGVPAGYLMLERTTESAIAKVIIQTAMVHNKAVTDPQLYAKITGTDSLTKTDLIKIKTAADKLAASDAHIIKPPNRKIGTIVALIRRLVRLNGIKVIFLDQIGLVRGERNRGDTNEAVLKGISNTLQELAHELAITIVILCQESADGETKNARAIEEDSDGWLSIVQERDKKSEDFGKHLHILIAKDSHQGNGGVRLPLVLNKDNLRFVRGEPEIKMPSQPTNRWAK